VSVVALFYSSTGLEDFRGWCTEVGFKDFEIVGLAGPTSAAVAYK